MLQDKGTVSRLVFSQVFRLSRTSRTGGLLQEVFWMKDLAWMWLLDIRDSKRSLDESEEERRNRSSFSRLAKDCVVDLCWEL